MLAASPRWDCINFGEFLLAKVQTGRCAQSPGPRFFFTGPLALWHRLRNLKSSTGTRGRNQTPSNTRRNFPS